MRMSLSVIFGALFSFFLLVAMTGLVSNIDMPPRAGPRIADDGLVIPTKKVVTDPPTKKLPVAPVAVAMPKPAGPTIVPDENGTTIVALPPGGGEPGVFSEWPTIGPIGPGKQPTENEQNFATASLQPLQQVPPLYPRELAARGIEGWVTLTFDVRQDGTVGNIQVRDAKPRGAFDDAARKAVQRWRYQPGLSSPAEQSVTLNFSLEN